jgi:hypothetical protein
LDVGKGANAPKAVSEARQTKGGGGGRTQAVHASGTFTTPSVLAELQKAVGKGARLTGVVHEAPPRVVVESQARLEDAAVTAPLTSTCTTQEPAYSPAAWPGQGSHNPGLGMSAANPSHRTT